MYDLDLLLDAALRAAARAAEIVSASGTQQRQITHKGAIDLVTDTDIRSQAAIIETLQAADRTIPVLAEEGLTTDAPARWIVDPLDGTTNFAHGYPVYSISIAFESDRSLLLGVVLDPLRNEAFVARRGKGAWLNHHPIHVSAEANLDHTLLATGFPYDIRTNQETNLPQFSHLARRCRGIRRGGSAALDLAYVAAGRLDGYWEAKLHPWDIAAGVLLVTEAGGTVTDYNGDSGYFFNGKVIASNGSIHSTLITELASIV